MWARFWDFCVSLTGKSTAQRLYEYVRRYASQCDTTICMLHNAEPKVPCPNSRYFCGTTSKKAAINFDAVKEVFCTKNHINGSWPSVDAVLYKDKKFLFVEIKSWRNFEAFQLKASDSQAEKERKIREKAKKFKLKQKVESSMEICRKISRNKKLFEKMPVVYVLVTDVATAVNPMVLFRARLGVLSYKAVNIPLYTQASTSELNAVGMEVRYKHCQEFDKFYGDLK